MARGRYMRPSAPRGYKTCPTLTLFTCKWHVLPARGANCSWAGTAWVGRLASRALPIFHHLHPLLASPALPSLLLNLPCRCQPLPPVSLLPDCSALPCLPAPAPAQDEIHKRYKHGSALQMMCWMNFW